MKFLCVLTFLTTSKCCDLEDLFLERRVSVETASRENSLVFRATTAITPPWTKDPRTIQARFELIDTFKDSSDFFRNYFDDINERHVNVTILLSRQPRYFDCLKGLTVPLDYIVFANPVEGQLVAASATRWTEVADQRVWNALGWSAWSEWTPCSEPCSLGIQQRSRKCLLEGKCPGYNIEQRHCNMFGCDRTINPLTLEDRHFFHPTIDFWHRVPDRPTAWRLKPYTYLWIPSVLLLRQLDSLKQFPKQFAMFLTIRLANDTNGTIFSLRSRTKQDSYLSLELREDDIKLTNAADNGTDTILIPAKLNDGLWHQVALSIADDNVLQCFIDCEWITKDLLRNNTFNLPDDSDFILGYLFSGDVEQFSIVTDPEMVNLQCANQKVPIIDTTAA